VVTVARCVAGHEKVIFSDDVQNLEVRRRVFGADCRFLIELRLALKVMCSRLRPFIFVAELDDPARHVGRSTAAFCLRLTTLVADIADASDFHINCIDLRALWFIRRAVKGVEALRYIICDNPALCSLSSHLCDAMSQMSGTKTTVSILKCFLGEDFPPLVIAVYSGGVRLDETCAMQLISAMFQNCLLLFLRTGTYNTRGLSWLLGATLKDALVGYRATLTLEFPAEIVSNGLNTKHRIDSSWSFHATELSEGDPRKRRTRTAHVMARYEQERQRVSPKTITDDDHRSRASLALQPACVYSNSEVVTTPSQSATNIQNQITQANIRSAFARTSRRAALKHEKQKAIDTAQSLTVSAVSFTGNYADVDAVSPVCKNSPDTESITNADILACRDAQLRVYQKAPKEDMKRRLHIKRVCGISGKCSAPLPRKDTLGEASERDYVAALNNQFENDLSAGMLLSIGESL